MSWSYTGNPGDSDKDLIRYMVGDINEADPEVQDEEIQYEIDKGVADGTYSALGTSIDILRRILARYKNMMDEKVGDVDVKWSQRYSNTKDLLSNYEEEFSKNSIGSAYGGGISCTNKDANTSNPDRVNPSFTRAFGTNTRIPG